MRLNTIYKIQINMESFFLKKNVYTLQTILRCLVGAFCNGAFKTICGSTFNRNNSLMDPLYESTFVICQIYSALRYFDMYPYPTPI